MTDEDIMDLSVPTLLPSGATRLEHVIKVKRILIAWLKQFIIASMEEMGVQDLSINDYTLLTKEKFIKFRFDLKFQLPKLDAPPLIKASATNNTSTPPRVISPALDFKRGIKKDATHFPVWKENRFFDRFEMEFMTQARAYDIDDVFDPQYYPTTNEEKELFNEKQKFAMSILVHAIHTDMGRTFVAEHFRDSDAQECWRKILKEARGSTRAELELIALHDKLIQARCNEHWQGEITGFLLYWKSTLRKLEDILPARDHYSWLMKKRLLAAAVNGHPHLAAVNKMDQDQIARKQKPLDFEDYFNILLSAAAQVDHEQKQSGVRPRKQVVNYLELTDEEYNTLTTPPSDYQLDINKTIGQATNHTTGSNNNYSLYVPPPIWDQLNKNVQDAIKAARNKNVPAVDDESNESRKVAHLGVEPPTNNDSAPEKGEFSPTNLPTYDDYMELLGDKLHRHWADGEAMEHSDIRRVLAHFTGRREPGKSYLRQAYDGQYYPGKGDNKKKS